ncbi:MAG: TolC family protein, partial [Cytophagales bacterium]|nr:TolC family protein [Cytophagales bacterium]
TTFFDLYGLSKALKFYDEEIPIIERTVLLYETQFNKGNLSLKEVVRLKSLLFSLRNEKLEYLRQILDCQQTLNVLLQTNGHTIVRPSLDSLKANSYQLDRLALNALLDSAKVRRYDLKAYQSQVEYASLDYKYQKSLGIPDPTIGLTYDRNSNYYSNYIGPALDIPLPVFNRNQGNVQAAKIRVMENQLNYQYLDKAVQQEVIQSYEKAVETDKLYREFDQRFTSDFDRLIDNVIANFEKRNITLIEFIDLYESYKATTLQKYQLQNDRLNSLEDLNFRTGSQIVEW